MERIEFKGDSLHKAIAARPASFLLLELDEFQLAKRFEDILQITFSDGEVYVTHIESVERDAICTRRGLQAAGLAVLLGLGELGDDGDT